MDCNGHQCDNSSFKPQSDKQLKALGISKEGEGKTWDSCEQCGYFYKFVWNLNRCPRCGNCLTCG